jgi:predicted transposase/invertase (TIGR01784 family)
MTNRYLDPTNDSLFKKIFSDIERLKEFINSILDLPPEYRIKEIEFISVEQLPIIYKGKRSVFDLKVKDESGNWYIIEMQKKNESDYLKRVQYYTAHSYVQQLKEGLTHLQLLPIMVISLIKTRIFGPEVPYISIHKTLESTTNKQYIGDLSYVFIELGKFNKLQLSNIGDEWLHLFKCASTEAEPPIEIKSNKVLDAYHLIELHNLTPEEYDLYIRSKLQEDAEDIALAKNFTEGEAKGREEGIQIGEARGKAKIALAMLVDGDSIEKVARITGLPMKEIEGLKRK